MIEFSQRSHPARTSRTCLVRCTVTDVAAVLTYTARANITIATSYLTSDSWKPKAAIIADSFAIDTAPERESPGWRPPLDGIGQSTMGFDGERLRTALRLDKVVLSLCLLGPLSGTTRKKHVNVNVNRFRIRKVRLSLSYFWYSPMCFYGMHAPPISAIKISRWKHARASNST
jgi:hypothetical protein